MLRGSIKPLLAAFIVMTLAPSSSWAWWDKGHKVVCQIAWQELNSAGRAVIEKALGGEEYSFAEACVWADDIESRKEYDWAKPHHHIYLPRDAATINLDRDCPVEPGCVVRAINRHIGILSDPRAKISEKAEALRFLGHFIGDLHQPLHVGYADDRGGIGIEVEFLGSRTNLHNVWDGQMLELTGESWKNLSVRLHWEITDAERSEWLGRRALEWALESYRLAELCAYKTPLGGWSLGPGYVRNHLPQVLRQLQKAGVRLAEALNAIASGDGFFRPESKTRLGDPAYYASTDGLTGEELRKVLQAITSKHRRLGYADVWDALRTTDEDPCNQDNVILLYMQRSQDKQQTQNVDSKHLDAWNREHVWPKSHGFRKKNQPAYSDLHHLRPADRTVNSSRGEKDFDDGGTAHREAPGAKADVDSFEPPDAVKGDIARMIFYMAVRYEGYTGEPDLAISNAVTQADQPVLGRLCALLSWHAKDPVDSWERRRNDRTQAIQGNRNPFIDHPEWVEELWADRCL